MIDGLAGTVRIRLGHPARTAQAQPPAPAGDKLNVLVLSGDDVGINNIPGYSHGLI